MKRRYRAGLWGVLAAAALMISGCSRSEINYQVAEAIGTVGQYENNEPVESPQMRQERELAEQLASEQEVHDAVMASAQALADSYLYDEAIDVLIQSGESGEDVEAALIEWQQAKSSLTKYTGTIAHLCFPTLIADTDMAFDGDSYASSYASSMITTDEFRAILESLYENDYILIDLHSVAYLETDEEGLSTMEMADLYLPSGKTPIIISQDNPDYADVVNGNGIAKKLVLDDDGNVKAVYTDDGGHDLTGDYDLIPILESFIEEHPDFSYQGARGIISIAGAQGVFGYDIGSGNDLTEKQETNRSTVARICKTLTDSGWTIASAGYTYTYLNSMTAEALETEIENWEDNVGVLLSEQTDILFYPYGAEVQYPSDQLEVLLEHGLVYLCGLWTDDDFMEQGDTYLRQTRRYIDGSALLGSYNYLTAFFDGPSVTDSSRS